MSMQEEQHESPGMHFSPWEAHSDATLWSSPCAWRPISASNMYAHHDYSLDTDPAYHAFCQRLIASDLALSDEKRRGSGPFTDHEGTDSRGGSPSNPRTPDGQSQVTFGSNFWAGAYPDPGILNSLMTSSPEPDAGVKLSDIQFEPDGGLLDLGPSPNLDDFINIGSQPTYLPPFPGHEEPAYFKADEGTVHMDFEHTPTGVTCKEDKHLLGVHDHCTPSPKPPRCLPIRTRRSRMVAKSPLFPPHRSQYAKTDLNHVLGRSRIAKRTRPPLAIASLAPKRPSFTPINLPSPPNTIPKSNPLLRNCPYCTHVTFSSPGLLAKHIAAKHTRPYICIFHAQGCPGTFAKRNEWARHVKVQHLRLSIYRCSLPLPPGKNAPPGICTQKFRRKDLYVAHLKRMHFTTVPSLSWTTSDPSVEAACTPLRGPPPKTLCPFCPQERLFTNWCERMAHVAEHLAKGDEPKRTDRWLEEWMIREKLFTRGLHGEWKVVGMKAVNKNGSSAQRKGAAAASTDRGDEVEHGGAIRGGDEEDEHVDDADDGFEE